MKMKIKESNRPLDAYISIWKEKNRAVRKQASREPRAIPALRSNSIYLMK